MTALFGTMDRAELRQIPLSPGPESSLLDVAVASFDQAHIRDDLSMLTARRVDQRLKAMAVKAYDDPFAWSVTEFTQPDAPFRHDRRPPVGTEFEHPQMQRLLADAARAAEADPGTWANIPHTREDILADVREELQAEMAEARETIALGDDITIPTPFGDIGLAGLAGEIGAMATDPIGIAGSIFGASATAPLARRLLIEAGIGMAGEAAMIPRQQQQAEFLGEEAPDPLTQILTAGAGGAVLSEGFRAIGRAPQAATRLTRAVSDAELLKVLRPHKTKLTDEQRGAMASLDADGAVMDADPTDDSLAHGAALAQAGEAVLSERPGDLPDRSDLASPDAVAPKIRRAPPPSRPAAPRRPPPAFDLGALPHPAEVNAFDPRELGVDPKAYQYKSTDDPEGVVASSAVGAARRWDAAAGAGVMVHERLDGSRFIVEGHQRRARAIRLMDEGHAPIELHGYIFREADGWTAEAAMVQGARTNIAAETGSVLDAAKIMRLYPQLADEIPLSRARARHAMGLTQLSDQHFGAVINGVIPEQYGAAVGRVAGDDAEMQGAIIDAMVKLAPDNIAQAEMVAREVRRLGLERRADAAQGELFGDGFDFGAHLVIERSRVFDGALRRLRGDRAMFARLAQNAEKLEEAGNVIARTENQKRVVADDAAIDALFRLQDEPGPVRDALDAAARTAKRSGVRAGVDEFLDALRAGIESGDVQRSLAGLADRRVARADEAGGVAKIRPEPTETGPFGPILKGYEGDWRAAALELESRQSGEAPDALSHPDVGGIALVWGKEGTSRNDGAGLAKILAWHPEMLDDLQGRLEAAKVVGRTDNRIQLESEKDRFAVRLDYDGERKTWLLTAFEKDEGGARRPAKRSTERLRDLWDGSSPVPPTHPEDALARAGNQDAPPPVARAADFDEAPAGVDAQAAADLFDDPDLGPGVKAQLDGLEAELNAGAFDALADLMEDGAAPASIRAEIAADREFAVALDQCK